MMSAVGFQVLAASVYVALAAAVLLGHPPLPGRTGRSSRVELEPARTCEGPWLVALASLFLYPLVILLVPGWLLASPLTLRLPLGPLVEGVGLGDVLVGALLMGWAFRSLGAFATVRLQVTDDHRIVQTGPYGRIRHPMYTANILIGLGITLTFLSAVLWVPWIAVVLFARRRAATEERLFLSSPRLRPGYDAYRARTGSFLPPCAAALRR